MSCIGGDPSTEVSLCKMNDDLMTELLTDSAFFTHFCGNTRNALFFSTTRGNDIRGFSQKREHDSQLQPAACGQKSTVRD